MNYDCSESESSIDLSVYDDEYSRASVPQASQAQPYDDIPDGTYEADIEDVSVARTATTGNPMVLWKLRIQGPQCQGRAVTKVRVITSKTLGFLKRDLERLDLHLDRLSDLPARTGEMVDRRVRIYKRTNPERRWTEVYFLGLAEAGQGQHGPGAWTTGSDDELPF